ncbi:hypothetical protein K443DRAFT_452947 [Laccaria amethystina LaAM-08-1]|uniref:Uncharacterized protein n=1 Tax=Laccaria amethystina LaAM-08-1 TaxID=1095629 RepID=A0A0C9XAH6_9AGAR|nr:hypothetical protein K443DRAFT_452947 [Laccaria amethystina LaAM-08-1]
MPTVFLPLSLSKLVTGPTTTTTASSPTRTFTAFATSLVALLHTIITSLERITFNGNPLQFMLVKTTYRPFISLFQQTGVLDKHPELAGFPNYAAAFAIELRRGSPLDVRDFVRSRFKNGTSNFQDVHVFGHHADLPVITEFVYRTENAATTSNRQWKEACGLGSGPYDILRRVSESQGAFTGAYIFIGLLGLFFLHKLVKLVVSLISDWKVMR